jgi:hypothetical protein
MMLGFNGFLVGVFCFGHGGCASVAILVTQYGFPLCAGMTGKKMA